MKKNKFLLMACIVGGNIGVMHAQLTLSGELRPRAEFRNGFQAPMDSSQSNAFFVQQRSRINVDYKTDDYEFYISVQDIRIWGDAGQLAENPNSLALHQAWAKANLNKNWGLKLGRQEIKYDDDRIFGNVDWAQQARSHDAFLIQYANEKAKLDLGVAFNQSSAGLTGTDYTGPSTYRDMYYAWYNRKIKEKVQTSLLAMMLGRQVNYTDSLGNPFKTINYVATLGTHTKFAFGDLKMDLNAYYQTGSDNSLDRDYAAYLLGLDIKYAISEQFTVGAGYETQSGTTETDTTKAYARVNHNFNPWFGTNHKFNGYMDYFYVGNPHGNAGLQDVYVKLAYKKEKWDCGLDVHVFMTGLGVEILDPDAYNSEYLKKIAAGDFTAANNLKAEDFTYKSNLGTEFDLSFGTKLNNSVKLKAGFSYMLATETLYHLKGVDRYNIDATGNMSERELPPNMWGYVMVIFKPSVVIK